MRRIAISLSKGGVAKSTTSISLAHGLALENKKVLLIDTDIQGQDSFLLGVKPKYTLADVVTKTVSPKDAIHEARPNMWLLAGGKSLAAVQREIARKDFGSEMTLSDALEPIKDQFDYVLIDTSPSWDTLTINSLFYAREVITPVSVEMLTLNSLITFCGYLDSVKRFNKDLQHTLVLPTFLDGRVKKSKEILEMIRKHFGDKVCDPIKYSVRISEAVGFGQTVFEYAPGSSGTEDYGKLVKRIING